MLIRTSAICFSAILVVLFALHGTPLPAAEWEEVQGEIVYYDEDGELVHRHFRYYLTTKHAFFHYNNGSGLVRMHIRHPREIRLYGKQDPISIILRNGEEILAVLNDPFIEELTGLGEFTFRAPAPDVQRLSTYTVPAEAIQSLSFR